MFSKILIANRGEIACRVIKTAQRLGIKTVAVYSEADAGALHTRMANEAVCIGPAASAQSYLSIDAILKAIHDTGAQAVHPGYGFLSENRFFAEALEARGVVFIGPPKGAIEAMGDKIESKKLALKAGVSTIPGHTEAVTDPEEAVRIARDIGYPVMLKASAGGGGKGMRLAWTDDECRQGLVSAMNEGRTAFGDDRVFIEKFIQQPRHIEIQIIADQHDNVVWLGERECSIQRRHQKVLEEAPSPFLTEAVREQMGEQAVILARQVGYTSAGTVEFVADANRNFYFLEMNTRLQVEHPVTEYVTGLDLVELMIRVAAGEPLPFTQQQVQRSGWALEARVYAEDPLRGFLPSTGRLTRYRPPQEESNVRVDAGVTEGSEISMFYDPMISKLITAGKTRSDAIDAMLSALDRYEIAGVSHNIPFLTHICRHPRFRSGDMTTNFIAEKYPEGLTAEMLKPVDAAPFAAVAAIIGARTEARRVLASGRLTPPAPLFPATSSVFLGEKDRQELTVHLERLDEETMHADVKDHGALTIVSSWRPGQTLFEGTVEGAATTFQVSCDDAGGMTLSQGGAVVKALVVPQRMAKATRLMPYKAPPNLSKFLLSPMPGLLNRVTVQPGDAVKAGMELAVVEAMKMENTLRATQDGIVKEVYAKAGDSLALDQRIVEFE